MYKSKIQKLFNLRITLFSGESHGYRDVQESKLDSLVAEKFNAKGVKKVIVYDNNYTKVVKTLEKSEGLNPLNKVTCNYCSKELQSNEVIVSEIWENYSRKNMKFCSKEHASFYQMGAEG